MRLGEVLEVGVRLLRRHWPITLVLALLFAGPGSLLTAVTGLHFTEVAADLFPGLEEGELQLEPVITQAEVDRVLGAALPYLGAYLLAGVLLAIGTLAFSAVVADDYHARSPRLGSALGACLRRTPSVLGVMLLTSLLTMGVLLAGIVAMSVASLVAPAASITAGGPGAFLALVAGVATVVALVYLSMRWLPAYPAMVEEDLGALAALRRSWRLSGDNVRRIFAVAAFAALTAAVVGSILAQLLAGLLLALAPDLGGTAATVLALTIGTTLLAPLAPVLLAVLYFDLRARRDSGG